MRHIATCKPIAFLHGHVMGDASAFIQTEQCTCRFRVRFGRAHLSTPRGLDESSAIVFPLPPECRRNGLVAGSVGMCGNLESRVEHGCLRVVSQKHPRSPDYSYLAELGRLLDRIALPRKEVLREGIEDIDAEAEVAAADGDVHADDLVFVGLVDLQRGLQDIEEVGECAVPG